MQLVLNSLLALAVVVTCLSVTFVVGMRRKVPFVLDAVRRSGRAMKPLVLRRAGSAASPTAVVEHVGRSSGRRYETPVVAARTERGFAMALPYGPDTDWLKNVVAAGHVTLRHGGDTHELGDPQVVPLALVDQHFAEKEQRLHRRFGVQDALLLRAAGA